jgi:chromatin segregation and condensation protein Rec8/ScpA/Scc1 (kleisin family)
VTFLALLDLLKTEDLYADQDDNFSDIVLRLPGTTPGASQTA